MTIPALSLQEYSDLTGEVDRMTYENAIFNPDWCYLPAELNILGPMPEMGPLAQRLMDAEIPDSKLIEVDNNLLPFRKAISYIVWTTEELVIAANKQIFWYDTIEYYKLNSNFRSNDLTIQNRLFHLAVIGEHLVHLQRAVEHEITKYQTLIGHYLGKFIEATHFDAIIHGDFL